MQPFLFVLIDKSLECKFWSYERFCYLCHSNLKNYVIFKVDDYAPYVQATVPETDVFAQAMIVINVAFTRPANQALPVRT